MKTSYHIFILLIFLILTTCKTSRNTSIPRNLEKAYDSKASALHPEIEIYNTSDTSSIIIEKIWANELLYNHANNENKLKARVKIIYKLYNLNKKQKLTDSLTTTFQFEKNDNNPYFILEIPVNAKTKNDYFLEIITIDQNRKNAQYSYKRIDRTDINSFRDFTIYNKTTGEPCVNPFIKKHLSFGVKNYKKTIDSLKVFYFKNSNNAAIIPDVKDGEPDFYEKHAKPDTSWIFYNDSSNYTNFEKSGLYYFSTNFFKTDSFKTEGFAMYNMGNTFPYIQTPWELIRPLEYLGFQDSALYTDTTGKYIKLAVDNFWLSLANNMERSRELLRIYYNRINDANKYFTSYKKGWKTDRGMIYIIYGLPDYLFKSGEEEKWIYNPTGIGPGISLTFKYTKNPLSSNHYTLEKEKLKYTGWKEAVELWKKGEILYYQN